MVNKILSIVISGVGGQGVLTLSEIIGRSLMKKGLNVKGTEIHGLAQRGGSVVSHLKAGFTDFSPIVDDGGADVVIGLEALETLRVIRYMNATTVVLINDNIIQPVLPSIKIPNREEIISRILMITKNMIRIDADGIARRLNSMQVVNTVMLGALAGTNVLPSSPDDVLSSLKERIPPRFHAINEMAFNEGYEISKRAILSLDRK